MTSTYLGQPLRSPEQVMDARRAQHMEMLGQIHAMLDCAEALIKGIANEQEPCKAAANSFADLEIALTDLRADYLAPADHDLREWHSKWEPVE